MRKINAKERIKIIIAAIIYGVLVVLGGPILYDGFFEIISENGVSEAIAGDSALFTVVLFIFVARDVLDGVFHTIAKKEGAENDFNNKKTRSGSNELTHEHNA